MNDSWFSRSLPDVEISLRDARDFILGSPLGRKAVMCSKKDCVLFLNDLLDAIYRLVQSCHMPEFTDHGLPHLCSLVDRVSRWELPHKSNTKPIKTEYLHEQLSKNECATLLIAILIHDIGMLSQNDADLPDDATTLQSKSQWPDIASWVRSTHVPRIRKLTERVIEPYELGSFCGSELFDNAVHVAMAHQEWPWQWKGTWSTNIRLRGLAAVVAVADLLDEDSARCDTLTLLDHREGNEHNRAHWLRHALTTNRILIESGRIEIQMAKPPGTSDVLKPVYSALRNHFKLVELYKDDLKQVDAVITNIDLKPATGIPISEAEGLAKWHDIIGFSNESALTFQLLRTFMPEALKDQRKCNESTLTTLRSASLEDVDLHLVEEVEGPEEPRTEYEKTFNAIAMGTYHE